MKKDKVVVPASKENKSISKSSSIKNDSKKKNGATFNEINSSITGAVEKTRARKGSGLANEGTSVSYEEER